MAGFRIKGKLEGVAELTAGLRELARGVRNRVVRRMVTSASRVVLQAAKSRVPVQHGLLKKALGVKTKTYGSGTVVAVVGPRVDAKGAKKQRFKVKVGIRTRGKNQGADVYAVPANYAHLVEFGHGGPQPAPPHPFLRPAFDETKDQARSAMAQAAVQGLQAEAARAARKKR